MREPVRTAPPGRALIVGLALVLCLASAGFAEHSGVRGILRAPSPGAAPGAHGEGSARLTGSSATVPRLPTPASPLAPGGFVWANLTSQLLVNPGARDGGALAWDPVDGYDLLFGGQEASGVVPGDTWSFSNGSWSNLTGSISGAPPKLVFAKLAYDPSDREMILFGGVNGFDVPNAQTWAYHDRSWTNLTGSTGATPPLFYFGAMSTDTTDGEIVLFGGTANGGPPWYSDTWTFRSGVWTNITATANAPAGQLAAPASSDDPALGGALLSGLYVSGSGYAWATLAFIGGAWHNLTALVTGSPAREWLYAGGYLAPLGAVALTSFPFFNTTDREGYGTQTAEFASDVWTNVTGLTSGPPFIGQFASVGDLPGDQGLLAYGGFLPNVGGFSGATWVLTAPPAVSAHVAHPVTEPGLSDALSSNVSGGLGPYSYRWSFGDGASSSAAFPTHAYAQPGEYTSNLSVSDAVGHTVNGSVGITVVAAMVATASASPSPATAGSTVALIGAWTGGLAPYTFSWTLGDANTSTAASLGHVYARAGTYSLSFTVTDSLGQSSAQTLTLQVQAAPSTGSSGSSSGSSSVSLTSGTGLGLLLGIVALALIAAVLGAMLARRPKSPPGPPSIYPAPPAGPSGYGAPPPAAGGPPPPPGAY